MIRKVFFSEKISWTSFFSHHDRSGVLGDALLFIPAFLFLCPYIKVGREYSLPDTFILFQAFGLSGCWVLFYFSDNCNGNSQKNLKKSLAALHHALCFIMWCSSWYQFKRAVRMQHASWVTFGVTLLSYEVFCPTLSSIRFYIILL